MCDRNTIWLPAGAHCVEPVSALPHVLDFNGELRSAERTDDSTIELSYENASRAFALLDRKPARLELDGAVAGLTVLPSDQRFVLLLPRGRHLVTIHTE